MEWRTIPGWPAYEVSEGGDIRRAIKSRSNGFCGLRKPYPMSRGYLYIVLRQVGQRRGTALAVHRLVCHAFNGPPPTPSHQAAHRDGSRTNNHWSNLKWATRSENEMDKVQHGRSNRGDRHRMVVLDKDQVLAIRARFGLGHRKMDIAADYGVAASTISSIYQGRSWAWL